MVSSYNKVLIFLKAAVEEQLLEHESIPKLSREQERNVKTNRNGGY